MANKWEGHRAIIQELSDKGMTDAQIGQVLGLEGSTVCAIRKKLGITKKKRKMTGARGRQNLRQQEPAAEGETYTDEAGLTVTRYPARFAEGVTAIVTAKAKR